MNRDNNQASAKNLKAEPVRIHPISSGGSEIPLTDEVDPILDFEQSQRGEHKRKTEVEMVGAGDKIPQNGGIPGQPTHDMIRPPVMPPGGNPYPPQGPRYGAGYPGQPGGQPGGYPGQPGGFPGQPGGYPGQQRGYPGQPGGYPGQPGGFQGQQGGYSGQPGSNFQKFPTMSRFDGDNRQNMAEEGGPSTYESSQVCWGQFVGWLGTYCCCCPCPNPYSNVPEGYSGVIMRFGKYHKLVGPGMHYLIPDLDVMVTVDKREKVVELKKQTVVSKDNTSFSLDAVLYYRISNTYKSKFAVADLFASVEDLAKTTLRNAIGRMTIQQFLEMKEHLAEVIEGEMAPVASTWGAKIVRVLVQDVFLPLEFRNSFSTGVVAKRVSEAQVIASKAEVQVAKLMKDAADALNTEAAFQIRYITALEAISKSANPKMIFFPADYNDVGAANQETMADELENLVKKK